MTQHKHKYDFVPDLPDRRDQMYAMHGYSAPARPRYVDLRGGCSAIKDQQSIGSCTSNALTGIVEFEARRAGRNPPDLSRLFLYYNERAIEHTTRTDSGAQLRDGIKSLADMGVCPEAHWPYDVTQFTRRPDAHDYDAARPYKIKKYLRLQGKDDMLNCLAAGYPFAFGFSCYESLESPDVARTGIVNLPGADERCLGGHAVYACGYDLDTDRALVANSWSERWGQKGYFTMPFSYLTDSNLACDFWAVQG